jgi:saccharopine dehydrogenase-like NADP-dependent oxidoreductase
MRIAVLGGAGKMGCVAVQALAGDPRVDEVLILDINVEQAHIVADYLKSPKVGVQRVDVKDREALVRALAGSKSCLNASIYYLNLLVMDACFQAGVHYTDMGGLFHTTRKQLLLHESFRARGVSAVLGMGTAPGIPNVQARYAADRLETVESIKIYDGSEPVPSDEPRFGYAIPTIMDELTLEPVIFRGGEFVTLPPLSDFEDYWFTAPLGLLPVHLSLHSEPATLPVTFRDKGVKECFFKINYWGMSKAVVDKVRALVDLGFGSREPIEVGGQRVVPREVMEALLSGYVPLITDYLAPSDRRPPDWVQEIATEVHGTKDGQAVTYRVGTLSCRRALPTGSSAAIAAVWLAEGRIPPGVHAPEAVMEPEAFFQELAEREVFTQVRVTRML